jgi:hypothetical protein
VKVASIAAKTALMQMTVIPKDMASTLPTPQNYDIWDEESQSYPSIEGVLWLQIPHRSHA